MARNRDKERALDAYLAAAARTGDRKAFAQLVRRWDPKLRAHAWRLLGESDGAGEAVQDAWTEIVRGLGRLTDPVAFPAWAYRIVSRRCTRLIGAAQARRRLEQAVAVEPAPEPEPSGAEEGDGERLRRAIAALPPAQRAAIALHHFEELSIAETAVALDVPAGTVKTRLMHARRKLRAALEGDE
jgi:RNA polymerase sigma factor (sigma-70 family)